MGRIAAFERESCYTAFSLQLAIYWGAMTKFSFSVTTRDGHRVEGIQIYGKDAQDAERKLRQMYHNCEVISCKTIDPDKRVFQSADIDNVLSLIIREN